jgi:hypothetical protein
MNSAAWLLLVHSIPPTPPYLRAKVLRRLTKLGALPLKRSAYLLPADESALEDLQWLRGEIRAENGDAWIVEGRFVAGFRDEEIREAFRDLRTEEYRGLIAEARTLLDRHRGTDQPDSSAPDADRRRLARRVEAARRIDFFHAEGRDELETLMATIDRLAQQPGGSPAHQTPREQLRGRTWVTRKGVKVDRMASAWLIRRFIDPVATFTFVPPEEASSVPGAIRYDMFEGEFTHDGNRCTFEVLLDVTERAADRALTAIAEIVHDLDVRDDKFGRPETAGVAALLAGIASRHEDDHRRIAESGPLFDALYASLGGKAAAPRTADTP